MELPAFLFFSDKMMRTCCLFLAPFFLLPPSFCWGGGGGGGGGLSFCSFLSSIRSLFLFQFPLLLFCFLFLLNFFPFLFLSFSLFLAFFSLFLSSFLSISPFHSAGFGRNYPILKQRASHVRCFKLLYINVNNGDRIGHSILRSSSLFKKLLSSNTIFSSNCWVFFMCCHEKHLPAQKHEARIEGLTTSATNLYTGLPHRLTLCTSQCFLPSLNAECQEDTLTILH